MTSKELLAEMLEDLMNPRQLASGPVTRYTDLDVCTAMLDYLVNGDVPRATCTCARGRTPDGLAVLLWNPSSHCPVHTAPEAGMGIYSEEALQAWQKGES